MPVPAVLRCAALSLALQLGRTVAHTSACADGGAEVCDGTANDGMEDASLIQLRGAQAEAFPNFGEALSNAEGYMKDIASKVGEATSHASTSISEGFVNGLTTLGDSLSQTFERLATQTETLQERMSASKADLTSGMVSAIALKDNWSESTKKAAGVPLNATLAQELNSTLALTTKAWQTMHNSVLTAVNTISNGLGAAGLQDAAAAFTSRTLVAVKKANGFVDSLHNVSLALWGSSAEKIDSAGEGSEEVLDKVNASLQAAEGYATSFPHDFLRAFKSLEEQVLNATRSFLSPEQIGKVFTSFEGARAQAQAAADGLGNASTELLEALDDGLNLTRSAVEKSGSPPSKSSSFGLLLVALSVAVA